MENTNIVDNMHGFPSNGSGNFGEKGRRNIKYKPLRSVAIFYDYFLQARGPRPPLDPLTGSTNYPEIVKLFFLDENNSTKFINSKIHLNKQLATVT